VLIVQGIEVFSKSNEELRSVHSFSVVHHRKGAKPFVFQPWFYEFLFKESLSFDELEDGSPTRKCLSIHFMFSMNGWVTRLSDEVSFDFMEETTVVKLNFAEFHEIKTCPGSFLDEKIDSDVSDRCFNHDGHDFVSSFTGKKQSNKRQQ
jgi:hypothetical protein